MTPKRIKGSCAAGWRMPAGAIYVGRPTAWGNPFAVPVHGSRAEVVAAYRRMTVGIWTPGLVSEATQHNARAYIIGHIHKLRGHDLARWCGLDAPFHADILLEIANGENSNG